MITSISIVWTDEDVIAQAEDMKITLTEYEIEDVLTQMEKNHDASLGINWDVIAYHINEVVKERKNKKSP